MRTKHVLMAMALPALFAACTSDEFMQEQPAGSLGNRPLLSADFTVDVEEAASTRFAWEDKNFKWSFEDGDQFGAAVTDPVTFGTISSESMLGNYIFGKGEDGKWRTNSQMVEGTYIYYSYEGFQNKSTRELVAFDLGTQNADLDDPTAVVNAKQLFFSPLYQIESETSDEAMPLQFYPYWSTAAFYIQNKTGQDLKLTQIALEDANNEFVIKGHIDPVKLNSAALKYAYDKESGEYAIDAKAFEKANGKKTYDEVMQLVDLAVANDKEGKASAAIALNCGGYVLADGESVTAYMVVPAHQAKALTAKIVVVDEDGLSKQVTVQETAGKNDPEIACTGISTRVFKRGSTYPVFGFNTDGKTMKALVVEKENLDDLESFYVDNKADLLNVINNNLGAISIYNFGDLAIDDEIAKAITEYTGTGITFDNAISVKCTGDATLEKTTFDKNVTVESGNVTFGEDVVAEGGMTLKGGKLTLTDGTYDNANVTVEAGELVLNKANQTVKGIVAKGGIVTIAKENKLSNIKLSFKEVMDEEGEAIPAVLNINAKLAANEALATKASTTVNNASEITLTAELTNAGIFNNGTATSDAAKVLGNGSLVNNAKATVNNYGTIKPATVTNNAEATVNNFKYFGLDGSGNATTSTNNGKIVMKNNTSRVYVSAGAGEIDNTAKGIVDATSASDMKIAVTISESMTNDEKLKELGKFNLLYLNGGTWTIEEAESGSSFDPTKNYANVTVILNGGNIHLDDKGLKVASLHVAKNATISGGRDASQSKLTSTKYITAAATATLTAEFAEVVADKDGKQLAVDMEGVYYLTSTGNIINTGSKGKTVTYKALKPLTVNMGKSTVSVGGAKLVFGTNVTVNFNTGTGQYQLAGDYSSETAPTDAEGAIKVENLVTDINKVLPNLATSEKVAVSGGAATASFSVKFASSATKTITVSWDGKAWVITKVA